MPQVTEYSARFAVPDFIERAKTQTLELPVYRNGALVAPSAGTFTLLDESGDTVDTGAVVVASSIATHALDSAAVPATLALSARWRERWVLTLAGVVHTFYRDAHLVRERLWPVITDADLTRLHSELRSWLADDASNLQGYLDGTWDEIQLWLLAQGRRPYLILTPWALRQWHLNLALAAVFRDYASSAGDGKYRALADTYDGKAVQARDALVLTYDDDEDGIVDAADEQLAGEAVLMATRPGRWVRGVL